MKIFGFNVIEDETVPKGTIEFRDQLGVIGIIKNIEKDITVHIGRKSLEDTRPDWAVIETMNPPKEKCHTCNGLGKVRNNYHGGDMGVFECEKPISKCPYCKGTGYETN